MASRYARVVLVWPIALPGSGELRAEIDAAADQVEIVREDDGALVISRGDDVLRIARPEIEAATFADGGGFARSHAARRHDAGEVLAAGGVSARLAHAAIRRIGVNGSSMHPTG